MNTTPAIAAAPTTGPTTTPNPHIQAVLASPKGRRFNRARRYAEVRPPAPRTPAPMLPEPGPEHPRKVPPWLARLQAELSSEEQDSRPPDGGRPQASGPELSHRPLPAPPQRPQAAPEQVQKTKQKSVLSMLRRPRRRVLGCLGCWENTPYTCTILGMLFAAYAIGLVG